MSALQHFQLMSVYNQQLNKQVYEASLQLSDIIRKKDLGAFFGSIHNTLNHILVGDIFWLNRFKKVDEASFWHLEALKKFPTPTSLRDVLFHDFESLYAKRELMDTLLTDWIDQDIQSSHLDLNLSYQSSNGDSFNKPFCELLSHLFNHQTHHRGQVSTLLFQQGIDIGSTDYVFHIPNVK